jgi:hypothetical protein
LLNPDCSIIQYFVTIENNIKKINICQLLLLKKYYKTIDSGNDILESIMVRNVVLKCSEGKHFIDNENFIDSKIFRNHFSSYGYDFFDYSHPEEMMANFFTSIILNEVVNDNILLKNLRKILFK